MSVYTSDGGGWHFDYLIIRSAPLILLAGMNVHEPIGIATDAKTPWGDTSMNLPNSDAGTIEREAGDQKTTVHPHPSRAACMILFQCAATDADTFMLESKPSHATM